MALPFQMDVNRLATASSRMVWLGCVLFVVAPAVQALDLGFGAKVGFDPQSIIEGLFESAQQQVNETLLPCELDGPVALLDSSTNWNCIACPATFESNRAGT